VGLAHTGATAAPDFPRASLMLNDHSGCAQVTH
jgi:hypothetical protein